MQSVDRKKSIQRSVMVRNSNLRHKTEQNSFATEGLKTAGWKKQERTTWFLNQKASQI